MAIVKGIQVLRKDNPRRHPTETQVFVFTFTDGSGERILQLDSVGSDTRQKIGKGNCSKLFEKPFRI